MKAIYFEKTGDKSVLQFSNDYPSPSIQSPNQILIRNSYSGVNFIDTYHRSGVYKVPLPCIPGREGSGIIEAIGSDVKGWKVGDRVGYLSMGSYGEFITLDKRILFYE